MDQQRSAKLVRNSGGNGLMPGVACTFCRVQAAKIRPFRPEFRTLLTFVGTFYPILWRCEPGFRVVRTGGAGVEHGGGGGGGDGGQHQGADGAAQQQPRAPATARR